MTDVVVATLAKIVGNRLKASSPSFRVIDSNKGYIVEGDGVKNVTMAMLQGIARIFGACFLAVAIGVLAFATIGQDIIDMTLRGGAAVISAGIAIYFLWFSSRGSHPEIQIDLKNTEVRQAIRNKTGRTSILSRFKFDEIGGVFIDRSFGGDGEALLVLRYKNTPQTMSVAQGSLSDLEALRDRIGKDLMVKPMQKTKMRIVPRRVRLAA